MVRVCKSNIISVRPASVHLSPSHYLPLNHWAEFNQTCYMTSPHDKGVREQYYFSVRRLSVWRQSICPSRYLLPNQWTEFNQTCYMTSPHGKGVREWVRLSVMLLATLARSVGIYEWRILVFSNFSQQNRRWHFMQNVFLGDNMHEMSKPIFWENTKKKKKINK